MSFQDDIQGQNTHLYPVVKIGEDYYSTNNVTIDGNYCKPILINIPSIKESVDVESRKFKISNVSLQFNNFPFDGVRFSDQLSESSLINTEATIYFKSPSDLQEVYKGIIRRISHDDSKVSVELEDLTEKLAHKNLPQAIDQNGVVGYLGDGNSIPDKYKNQPIPICYGHVDKSPLVISESFSKYQADSKDIKEFSTTYSGFDNTSGNGIYLDPLQVDIDGEIHHVVRGDQYIAPEQGDNSIMLLPSAFSGIVAGDDITEAYAEVSLRCRRIATPKFSITSRAHDSDLINTDFLGIGYNQENINAITDGNDDTNNIEILGERNSGHTSILVGTASNVEKLLLSLEFDVTPSHDTVDDHNKIIGFKINGYNLPKLLGNKILKINHVDQLYGQQGDTTSVSHTYDETGYNMIWRDDCPHADIIQEVFGFLSYGNGGDAVPPDGYDGSTADIKLNFYDIGEPPNFGLDMPIILFSGSTHTDGYVWNRMYIQFRTVGNYNLPAFDSSAEHRLDITGNIDNIEFMVENESFKLFNNDFYASVIGRINTFDDHPDAPTDDFIENPIDIIYDLVRSELGLDAINEDEYAEARLAHDGWKFGFTQTKKISSKKLIEDIAKSTKCFPKFKNDGTFGFNTIKDSYDIDNDYEDATPIKESEVISYSFKKTKPEQIYKKVTVSYNKDYAQDSYLKTALSTDLGDDPYYGIENSSDAHLEFESDYIRNRDTADDLVSFLSEQYKNDHLLFNLKLPLQYINLEIGDLVKFEDLFQGVKAYGIDYTEVFEVNGQYRYPLFMVTSTTKNLSSVSVECMQLHNLDGDVFDWTGVEEEVVDPDDYATYDGDDIEISGNVAFRSGLQNIDIYVDDLYNYSELLGGASYFKISGIERPADDLPDFGETNLVNIEHSYYPDSEFGSANIFTVTWANEVDHNNDGVVDDINSNPGVSFGIEEGEQVTIVLSSYTMPEPSSETPIGDINSDGIVNILDIVQLVDIILNDANPNADLGQADVNGDGGLNILDIVQIVNYVLGNQ